MKYVKKPDTVEAFQLLQDTIIKNLPGWTTIYWGPDETPPIGQIKLAEYGAVVGTPSGANMARWTDFVVYRGWTNEGSGISHLEVIKSYQFSQQYEPVVK